MRLTLLFLINAFLPLITTLGLLAWFIWPRLLAVREFYADAGAASVRGEARSLQSALGYFGNYLRERPANGAGRTLLWPNLGFSGTARRMKHLLGFDYHPPGDDRALALRAPERILAAPLRFGLLAGVISAILDVLMIGTLSAQYAAQVPGILPVALGFLAASICLLPTAIRRFPGRQAVASAVLVVACVVACRMGWHLFNLALLWVGVVVFPNLTAQILSEYVHGLAGALEFIPGVGIAPAELISLAIDGTVFWAYLGLLISVSLAGMIWLEARLRAATLTWYALPGGEKQLRRVLASVTIWTLALGVAFWLPLAAGLADILSARPSSGVGWLAIVLVGLCLLATGGLWLLSHHRFNARCPACDTNVPGNYILGRKCPTCERKLWPALEANY